MADPGPPVAPGPRPGPPTRPHPAGQPAGTRDATAPRPSGPPPGTRDATGLRPTGPPPGTHLDHGQRLFSRVVRLPDGLDPLALAGDHGFVWCAPTGAVLGTGSAARIPVATGPARIERAAEAVAALLEAAEVSDPEGAGVGPAAVGALPFHPGTPGELVVPELLVRIDTSGRGWAVLTGPAPIDPPSAADLVDRLRAEAAADDRPWPRAHRTDNGGLWTTGASPSPAGLPSRFGGPANGGSGSRTTGGPAGPGLATWRAGVLAALAAIGDGRLDKVVLAREATVEAEGPWARAEVLRRLRRRPGGATFLYAAGGFVGASPELLVRRRGRVATSRPMAGTVPRGDSAAAEADGLARLTGSPKEAVEHRLVVDAVADGLAKVADRVQVGRPEVVRLATVAHLATEITADLTGPLPTALELAGLLHPTPAVGGSPRDAALAAIAALEPFDRGCYAGPVGWVDHAGDGEWAIALRCATLDGRRAHLLAGAGIVPGSDPDAEWAETEYKLRAVLEVLLSR
jgi:menaquinone-specific isochorismate synthase